MQKKKKKRKRISCNISMKKDRRRLSKIVSKLLEEFQEVLQALWGREVDNRGAKEPFIHILPVENPFEKNLIKE